MRVVIVGYGEMLNALVYGVLISNHDLVGVFRHENVLYSRLKRFLYDLVFPSNDYRLVKNFRLFDIIAPSVNSKKFRKELKRLNADVVVVGSWSEKFEKDTIETPNTATINVHPSLLPLFRGPNPYFQVIKNNETKSGITFHLIDEKLDTGKILHQVEVNVSVKETGKSLKYKCTSAAKNNIIEVLDNLQLKLKNAKAQNNDEATYQKQITLSESILDFEVEDSLEIDRRIRALNPWLKCHIPYKSEFFTFEKHRVIGHNYEKKAGEIVAKSTNSISIVCRDGVVIEFSDIKIKRPFAKLLTKLYLKYFVV